MHPRPQIARVDRNKTDALIFGGERTGEVIQGRFR